MRSELRLTAAAAAAALVLSACDGASLKTIIEGLVAREQLGLIQEITITPAGDSIMFGDPGFLSAMALNTTYTISKYEITNAQYKVFIDAGGYRDRAWWTDNGWVFVAFPITAPFNWNSAGYSDPQQPVSGVSWYEAVAFCNWRSVQEGLTIAYDKKGKLVVGADGYHLPTELEWEYAASKGDPASSPVWAYAYGPLYDATKQAVSPFYPSAVGSKSPGGDSRQGVADLNGNIAEWCSDNYQMQMYPQSPDFYYFSNDTPATTMAVVRGGCYSDASTTTASNARGSGVWIGDRTTNQRGFRVARWP